ncbi:ABC transporter G family member 10-like protein [Tanacetum coccineum]
MTVVAGPSGAGKTTLLEILAGVIPPCRVSGQLEETLLYTRAVQAAWWARIMAKTRVQDCVGTPVCHVAGARLVVELIAGNSEAKSGGGFNWSGRDTVVHQGLSLITSDNDSIFAGIQYSHQVNVLEFSIDMIESLIRCRISERVYAAY